MTGAVERSATSCMASVRGWWVCCRLSLLWRQVQVAAKVCHMCSCCDRVASECRVAAAKTRGREFVSGRVLVAAQEIIRQSESASPCHFRRQHRTYFENKRIWK